MLRSCLSLHSLVLLYLRTRIDLSLVETQREPLVGFVNFRSPNFVRAFRSLVRISSAPRSRHSLNSPFPLGGGECYEVLVSSITARYLDRGKPLES